VLARRKPSYLVLVLIALVSSVVGLSQPAHAISAPQRAEVHYTSSYAEVRWSAVSDATSYSVEVSKDGYYGPWRWWNTSSATTVVQIPLTAHPYRDQQGAYRYKVIARNSAGSASRSVVLNRSEGYGVSTADHQKAASKASSCLKRGLKAGATSAAGAGVYAVAAAWIPGVNAVTASAVGATVGGSAGAAYVVCLLPW
jgi:hypothetical protein